MHSSKSPLNVLSLAFWSGHFEKYGILISIIFFFCAFIPLLVFEAVMAEVLGVLSGGAGIASLAIQPGECALKLNDFSQRVRCVRNMLDVSQDLFQISRIASSCIIYGACLEVP